MSLESRFVNTWKGNGGSNGPALIEASLLTPWWKWTRDIPNTVHNVIILASVVFASLSLAWVLDYLASNRLYTLLCANEELEVLKSTETIKGVPFYLDRLCDPPTPLYSAASLGWARAKLKEYKPKAAAARGGGLGAPSPSLVDNVEDPVDTLLGQPATSGLLNHRRVTSSVIAWGGRQGGASCFSRCRALHPFILQYTGHRLYFGHKLLVPFTTFDPLRSRLTRTTLVLCELLLTLWLGSIFFKFRSDAPGLTPGFDLAEDGPNAIFVSIITIPANILVVNALAHILFAVEDFAFLQRYPFIAAEMQRRKAAERRLVTLGDVELAAELERAMKLGREALGGGKDGGGGSSGSGSNVGEDGEGGHEATNGGVDGGESLAVRGGEVERSAPSYLLLAPKSDVLLLTAAAKLGVSFESKSGTDAKNAASSSDGSSSVRRSRSSGGGGGGGGADGGSSGGGGEEGGLDEGSPTSSPSSSKVTSNASGGLTSSDTTSSGSESLASYCCWCCRPPPRVYPSAPPSNNSSSSSSSSSERAAATHAAEKKARALAAAERGLEAAQRRFEAVEAEGRAAYLAPLEWYTWGITLPFLLGLAVAAALGLLLLLFLWYLLLFAKINGDDTTSAWLVQWVATQVAQHAILSLLVPYLGTSWTYCVVPAWRASLRHHKLHLQLLQQQQQQQQQGLLGAGGAGGGPAAAAAAATSPPPPPTLLLLLLLWFHQCCGCRCGCGGRQGKGKARKHPGAEAAEEEARGRIMTQAASIASDLPPAFALFAYAFAVAAGSATVSASDRLAAFTKSALQGKDEAALEEAVKEEEAKALGMEGGGEEGEEGEEGEGEEEGKASIRLTPSQLHLLTVGAPLVQRGVAAVAQAAAAASATPAPFVATAPVPLPSQHHPLPQNLNLSRLGLKAHEDEAMKRIQERHSAALNLPGVGGGHSNNNKRRPSHAIGEEKGGGGARRSSTTTPMAAAGASGTGLGPPPPPPLDAETYASLNLSRLGSHHGKEEGERIARRIQERHEAAKHLPGITRGGSAAKKGGGGKGEEGGGREETTAGSSADIPAAAAGDAGADAGTTQPVKTEAYQGLNLSRLGNHDKDEGERIAKRIQERHEAAKHLPGIHGKKHKAGGGGEGGSHPDTNQ